MPSHADESPDTTAADSAAAAELAALVSELNDADDNRWWDAVVDLIDDLVHAAASRRYNEGPVDPGEDDEDAHQRLHDEADLERAELSGTEPSKVTEWLIGQLGAAEALAEIRDRLVD